MKTIKYFTDIRSTCQIPFNNGSYISVNHLTNGTTLPSYAYIFVLICNTVLTRFCYQYR